MPILWTSVYLSLSMQLVELAQPDGAPPWSHQRVLVRLRLCVCLLHRHRLGGACGVARRRRHRHRQQRPTAAPWFWNVSGCHASRTLHGLSVDPMDR